MNVAPFAFKSDCFACSRAGRGLCCRLKVYILSKFLGGNLIPNAMVSGGGELGRGLVMRKDLLNGISAPMKGTSEKSLLHEKTQRNQKVNPHLALDHPAP